MVIIQTLAKSFIKSQLGNVIQLKKEGWKLTGLTQEGMIEVERLVELVFINLNEYERSVLKFKLMSNNEDTIKEYLFYIFCSEVYGLWQGIKVN